MVPHLIPLPREGKGVPPHRFRRGFVFDILSLFFIILILSLAILVSYMVNHRISQIAHNNGYDGVNDMDEVIVDDYKNLDLVVPFLFGFASVIMLTFAYLSNSPTPVIVMFMLFGMIIITLVTQFNKIGTEFLTQAIGIDGTVADFHYTRLVLEHLPLLLTMDLVIMGVITHLRGSSV